MARLAKILPYLYFVVDVSILIVAFFGAFFLFDQHDFIRDGLPMLVSLIVLWLIVGNTTKLYRSNLHNGFTFRMISYSNSYSVFLLLFLAVAYAISKLATAIGDVLFLSIVAFLVLDAGANSILIYFISKFRRRQTNIKHTLVAGTGSTALRISSYMNSNPDFGFHINGFLRCKHEECRVKEDSIVGNLKDLKEYLSLNPIDEIVIALPYSASKRKKIKNIISTAEFHGARVSYVPDYQAVFGDDFRVVHDGLLDAVKIRQLPLDEISPLVGKAVFDAVFSASILFLLSPILLVIAVLIKLDSKGPVFYRPLRSGARGKLFRIYKFRSMYQNDNVSNGTLSTVKDDPRITKLGAKLRKYNLDELPQFLNVLLGDMSVVGPRPHRNFLNQQMRERAENYMLRYYFRPGITGWAQVNGWRGPTETQEQITERTAHDLWYIMHWSFILDLKIVYMTIFGKKSHINAF